MQLDSGWTDAGGRPIRMWRASLTRYAANAPAAEQRATQRRGQVAHPKPDVPVGTIANPVRKRQEHSYEPRALGEYFDPKVITAKAGYAIEPSTSP